MDFIEILKDIMLDLKLNQTEFAKRLGVYPSLISEYKNGKKLPSLVALSCLCEIIGADANYILGINN